MKKIKLIGILGILGLAMFGGIKILAGTLTLEVKPGPLYIGASGTVLTVQINESSNTTGYITGTLPINAFRIADLSARQSGYYTTIKIGNLLTTGASLSAKNIFLKTLINPTLMLGRSNPAVQIGSGIRNQYGNIEIAKTYYYRPANQGIGPISKYGDTLDIKIIIPPNQKTGTYKGKIYYFLYK